ncbi:hypothetical protein [Shouchella shacheensis]|uniref:hypothetical protein n=1 Tax=Shouchella shacheensis TaxID=1649580 RepID=UPI00074012DA|nr:hypothetical protein [Shouchella shacheensis]
MYYPHYHCPAFYNRFLPLRQYPPVDTTKLSQSVKEFRELMQQSERLLDRLGDTEFAYTLMEEAQQGNQSEVNRLIRSIAGLTVPTEVRYTPSGIIFDLQSSAFSEGSDCCTLRMTLKWGQ